ncbi:MAG: hypothetical protein AB7F40_12270 [Victivallaceae bacterium]|nr:hypothetical protein [Victivallaceae bacterium]
MSELIYLGKFQHVLDGQSRVSIPSEWREAEDGPANYVLFRGRGDALIMFPSETFLEFVGRVRGGAFASDELQELLAWVGERTRRCQCDKQGRVKLDRTMLDDCGIGDKLELVGAVTHMLLRAPQVSEPEVGRDEKFFARMREFAGTDGADAVKVLASALGLKK